MYSLELDTYEIGHENTSSYFSYVEEKINREVDTRAAVVESRADEGIIVVDFLDA